MSLSCFLKATSQNVYQALPTFAMGTAASAALSYAVNHYTSFTLSNPMDAAKFTAVAIIGVFANKNYFSSEGWTGLEKMETERLSLRALASHVTCIGLIAYAAHSIANSEKTIVSFALLSIQAAASLLLANAAALSKTDPAPYFEFDTVGFRMIQNVYQNIHRTVAAAGSAWLAARTFNTLGLDPKTAMIFTAATSTIYYATQPLFVALEGRSRNNFSRELCLLGLVKVSADKLNLPLYQEFAKACAVAGTFIAIFDNADQCISSLSFWDKKPRNDTLRSDIEADEPYVQIEPSKREVERITKKEIKSKKEENPSLLEKGWKFLKKNIF